MERTGLSFRLAREVGGRAATAVLFAWCLILGPADARETAEEAPAIRFEEVGEAAGARYLHHLRRFGEGQAAQVLETFTVGGATVAVGDYDGDGWEDLFLTDSALGEPSVLLRNVTGAAGHLAFLRAVASADLSGGNDDRNVVADSVWLDYDGDGWLDLLVARFGTPLLYRNRGGDPGVGGPRFEEVSREVGLDAFANTVASVVLDADGDGWADVLLGHYFADHRLVPLSSTHVLPADLDQSADGGGITLWRNVEGANGGRRFVDANAESGLDAFSGWTLDVGAGDLDDDGDPDLYVAADFGTDRLYHNRGDGTFVDDTELAIGVDTRKGMNVDTGDFDRDGRLDVFVSNITDDTMRECNMLWQNLGGGAFRDVSRVTGTCDSDWGWGGKFGDFDNDGWLDLYTVNGLRSAGPESYLPLLVEALVKPGADFADIMTYPAIGDRSWSGYQKSRLFRNRGGAGFADVAEEAGVDNDLDGRGIGVADYDRDGRLDLFQTAAGQPSLLYRNTTDPSGHWIELELAASGPDELAIGARVTVEAADARWVREVDGGNGYASQSSRRLHVGLGDVERLDRVEVRWPDGRRQRFLAPEGGSAMPTETSLRLIEPVG